MQTRKRAKSVNFGKKVKEKDEKETVKEAASEEVLTHAAKKVAESVSEKADEKNESASTEAPLSSELSTTPPKSEEEPTPAASSVATPAIEFVTDTQLSPSPEASESSETPSETQTSTTDTKSAETLSSPLSTEPPQSAAISEQPVTTQEPQQATSTPDAQSQGLSDSTPQQPQSAFTIQTNDAPLPTVSSEGKRRFGFYFFIVALISFVLGLGAIVAASYFGLIKVSLPYLPSMLAAKTAPTPMPTIVPTVAPTENPVDLTAYTISVLNGSTAAGKAAEVKTSLTTAGYKVTSVGNADNTNYTKTEIAAKSTVAKTYLSKLQDELNKSFTVDSTVNTLPSSSPSDVTVTLGSQTAQ